VFCVTAWYRPTLYIARPSSATAVLRCFVPVNIFLSYARSKVIQNVILHICVFDRKDCYDAERDLLAIAESVVFLSCCRHCNYCSLQVRSK